MKIYIKLNILSFIIILNAIIGGCVKENEVADIIQGQPNIIIIYADDVGYGDIGTYGAELIPTPHIDQMAETGLKMTSAYATSATCTPSRYSLLTGEYAFRNERAHILDGDAPLLIEPGSTTLPALFQSAGYKTSIIGKWHLGLGEGEIDWNKAIKPGPLEVGFDESFFIPTTNDRVPTVFLENHYVYGLNEADYPLEISYDEKIGELQTGESHPELLRYQTDLQHSGTIVNNISRIGWQTGGQSAWWDDKEIAITLADRTQNFIEKNKNNSFFLFLSMHENHEPRVPNPMFVGKSGVGLRGDSIVEVDWVVNQVMSKLDSLGLRENTLVIFTSDNGPIVHDGYKDGSIENSNGHLPSGPFRGGKYTAFEGGTRVPFIVNWPGVVKAGEGSEAIYSQVDIMASLAALVGLEIPKDTQLDSFNYLPVLLGQNEQGREHVVQQGYKTQLFGIRKGDWKLIPSAPLRPETPNRKHNLFPNPLSSPQLTTGNYLFNLANDPGETVNLAAKYPEKVQELTELLDSIRSTPERLIE